MRRPTSGTPVTDVLPIAVGGGGNVTVTFAALSYCETLAITVTADPVTMPEFADVADALQDELDALSVHTQHSETAQGASVHLE